MSACEEDTSEDAVPHEMHVDTPRTPRKYPKGMSSPRQMDEFVERPPETPRSLVGEAMDNHAINAVVRDLNKKIAELADLVTDLPMRLIHDQHRKPSPDLDALRDAASYPSDMKLSVATDEHPGWRESLSSVALSESSIVMDARPSECCGEESSVTPSKSLALVTPNRTSRMSRLRSDSTLDSTEDVRATASLKSFRRSNSNSASAWTQHITTMIAGKASVSSTRLCIEMLFEPFSTSLILCNAIFKGFSLQYHSEVGERLSWARIVDLAFAIAFFLETIARVFSLRQKSGARDPSWRQKFNSWTWDIFDAIVVSCMVCDEVLRIIADVPWANPSYLLSVLRIFRVTSTLKTSGICDRSSIGRQARLLGLSIKAAFSTMLCVLVCLASFTYLIALVMANGSLDLCGVDDYHEELCFYFGTLWKSCASAFQVLLGGINWVVLVDALNGAEMHYHASVLILAVTLFTVGLLQIVTGMFVWLVRDISEMEQKLHFMQDHLQEKRNFVEQMVNLFEDIDLNSNGLISKDELALAFQDERITSLFVMMDLDCTAVECVFELLDLGSTGFVDVQEFSLGCLRLRGKARAVDLEKTRRDVTAILAAVELLMPSQHTDYPPSAAVQCSQGEIDLSHNRRRSSLQRCGSEAKSLVGGKYRKLIEEPDLRALTLSQLQDVASLVRECCQSGSWTDPQNGASLDVAKVNLYDFAFHHINPQTCSDCITLVGLSLGDYKTGDILTQVHVDTGRICAKGEVIKDSSGMDLRVHLLKGQFVASDDSETRQSHRVFLDSKDCVGALQQVLQEGSVSYKELVSPIPTKPEWFVCHWWGEAVLDFVACCEEHSSRRHANTYWVCAYANRQHDLGADIGDDPENSSFRKAMAHATGLLLVLDRSAIAFQRIWCCFELFQTVTSAKMLDIVTMARQPRLLTQFPIADELPVQKFLREKHFPLSVLSKGVQVSLENGSASKPYDKVCILRSMGKDLITGEFSLELQRRNVDFANRALRGYIAAAAWPQAITHGRVLSFDRKSSEAVRLPCILKQDCDRVALEMCFSGMQEVRDADIASIALGLPAKLASLSLSFESCYNITDRGLISLADSIVSSSLKKLELDFTGCKLLTDDGISYLGMRLPSTLSNVSLQFALIPNVSKHGAKSFADHLPTSLSQLRITFRGTAFDHQFDSIRQLRKMTR